MVSIFKKVVIILYKFLVTSKGDKIMAVQIDHEKCIGCGACVDVCPVGALSMDNEKAVVDKETCIDCGACIPECPVEAISLPE
jgi:ferredoxin